MQTNRARRKKVNNFFTIFLFLSTFLALSYKSILCQQIDEVLYSKFDFPKDIAFHNVQITLNQKVMSFDVQEYRDSYFCTYVYKGYEGEFKFFKFQNGLIQVNKRDFLVIKCLQALEGVRFDEQILKKEIKSKIRDVKNIQFDNFDVHKKNLTNENNLFKNLDVIRGYYTDKRLKIKRAPFKFSLDLFLYSWPYFEDAFFEERYINIDLFEEFYKSIQDKIVLLFKFEFNDKSENVRFRRILIHPFTSKVVFSSLVIGTKKSRW